MRVVVAVLMTVFLSLGTVFSLFAADGDGQRGKGHGIYMMIKC